MKKYYLHNGSDKVGPFNKEELLQKGIVKSTLLWVEGNERWTCAENFEELHSLFYITNTPIVNSIQNKKTNFYKRLFLGTTILLLLAISLLSNEVIWKRHNNENKIINSEHQKKGIRNAINEHVKVTTKHYSALSLKGLSKFEINISNNTNYTLNQVEVFVDFLKNDGLKIETKKINFNNIEANDNQLKYTAYSNNISTIHATITVIYSTELNLCYTNTAKPSLNNNDPYRCIN